MLYKGLCFCILVCCIIGCMTQNSDEGSGSIFPTPPVLIEEGKNSFRNQIEVVNPAVVLEPRVVDQVAEITPIDDVAPHLIMSTVRHGDRDVALKTDRFIFIFDEEIHATNFIKIIDNTTGLNMGWMPFIENKKIELVRTFGIFAEGIKLLAGHVYTIQIHVADTSLNWTEHGNITFLTEMPAVKVSFKEDIQPILAERCAIPGCHAAPGAGGLDLSQYDTFKKGGNGGAAFDAGNSKASLVVKRIGGGGMPPIPPPLDANQIQLFIDWIDEGGENN